MAEDTSFGQKLIESLQQALAFQRGELAARARTYARRGDEWVLVRNGMATGPALHKERDNVRIYQDKTAADDESTIEGMAW